MQTPLLAEDKADIVRLAQQGMHPRDIAQKYASCVDRIRGLLRKRGVKYIKLPPGSAVGAKYNK